MNTLGVKSLKNMPIQKLPFKGYLYASGAINLVAILATVAANPNLPPVVPLYYGLPVGNSQLVSSWGLVIAPLSAMLITTINTSLALYLKGVFLKKILAVGSFFISILSIVTIIKVILLVGFW